MGSPKKTISYRFDSVGNRVGMTDPDGGRFTYAYDAVNRISNLVNPQGDRTTYAYDPGGRRTVKKLANGTRASFSYDAASNTNEPRVYGNLVSQRRGTDTHWYHFDVIGSTRELTNANQAVTDTRLYDAWGGPVATSGGTRFPFQYIGGLVYVLQAETLHYYVRARHLSPYTGSWLSVDFLWEQQPACGQYSYSCSRPTTFVDPSGLLVPGCREVTYGPWKTWLDESPDKLSNGEIDFSFEWWKAIPANPRSANTPAADSNAIIPEMDFENPVARRAHAAKASRADLYVNDRQNHRRSLARTP